MDTITDAKPVWLKESSSGTSAYYGIEGLAHQISAVTIGVTDGALQNTIGILKTLKEKAIQPATDTSTEVDRAAIQKEINASVQQIDDNALADLNAKFKYSEFDILKDTGGFVHIPKIPSDNLATQIHIGAEPNNNVLSWESFNIREGQKVIFDKNNYLDIVNAHVGIKPGGIDGIAKNSQTAPIIDENVINIYGYGSTVGSADGIAKNSQTAPTIHGILYGADNSAISSLSGDFIGNYADGNGGAIYYVNSGVIIDDKIQPEQTIAWFGVAQNYSSKVSSAFFNLVALENSSDFVL